MTDETLFADASTETVDPNKSYVAELVGEGKKFADVEALARGKIESDLFIGQLTAEAALLREEVQRRKSMEELMDNIKTLQSTPPASTTNNQNQNPADPPNPNNPVDIHSEIETALEQREAISRAKTNLNYVSEVLERNYGPGFAKIVADKAKEMGVGLKFIDDLAKTTPKAVFAMLQISETPSPTTRQAPAVRSNPGTAQPSGVKNFKYYQDLRRKNPSEYFKYETHQAMLKALETMGDDFYA
jgi:hypothetical protein